LGVLNTVDAIRMAKEQGLDLIEISANASPPVCKIMNLGKFKYEKSKREREARKKQHIIKLKEIKLRPRTDTHDYKFKINHAREFLEKGDRVRITVVFRGREMAHLEFGREVLNRVKEDLSDIAIVDMKAKMEGKRMMTVLIPISGKGKSQRTKPSKKSAELKSILPEQKTTVGSEQNA